MAPATTTAGPSATGEQPKYWRLRLWDLLFLTDKSNRYHLARQSFLTRFENIALILITLFSLLSAFNIQNVPASLAAFLVTTTLLIFQPAKAAAEHYVMSTRFASLLGDIETTYDSGFYNKETYLRLARIGRELAVKEKGEYFRALEAVCHNDVVRMRRCDPNTTIPVPEYMMLLMNLLPFPRFGTADYRATTLSQSPTA